MTNIKKENFYLYDKLKLHIEMVKKKHDGKNGKNMKKISVSTITFFFQITSVS